MINFARYILSVFALLLLLTSCEKKLVPVDVEIKDPIRHYSPVIQGENLGVTYEIENKSDEPLFIQEVQTSCGCIIPRNDLPIVILPHKTGFLRLTYNSIKNTGFVEHYVWMYGNFADSIYREMRFDTNVVPNADYTRDYEQLWHEKETRTGSMRDLVDGESTEKGYRTEDWEDPRTENREQIEDQVEDFLFK